MNIPGEYSLHLRIWNSLRRRGLLPTVQLCAVNIIYLLRNRLSPRHRRRQIEEREFDRRFGVVTAPNIQLHHLHIESPNRAYGHYYGPTPYSDLKYILEDLKLDWERFTFIDLGSGLGRAILTAKEFSFDRIIGVEFSHELHEIAEENLRKSRGVSRCTRVELVCGDAAQYRLPEGPCVVYMFNPFGAEVMKAVLDNATRARDNELWILYYNPVLDAMIKEYPLLSWVKDIKRPGSEFKVSIYRHLQNQFPQGLYGPSKLIA